MELHIYRHRNLSLVSNIYYNLLDYSNTNTITGLDIFTKNRNI